MSNIHSTAIVSSKANISSSAKVGPYCIIGDNVVLKDNVTLISHVTIDKNTVIDEGTVVYPFAVIGFPPQDLKFEGEESHVYIGKNTVIREHTSIHLATKLNPTLTTTVGDNCLIMGSVHIAHDCSIGNNVIIANPTVLGGHVVVDDCVIIGGNCAVHQFSRIGKLAFIGGGSLVTEDIVPYALYSGSRRDAIINGVNLIGLKRYNYSKEDIHSIKKAYETLFDLDLSLSNKIDKLISNFKENSVVDSLIKFLQNSTSRNIHMKYRTGK